MSLIKKTDVKNHLSARHRTEIHLEPAIQVDVTALPNEQPVKPNPAEKMSNENRVNLPAGNASKQLKIAPSKSEQD